MAVMGVPRGEEFSRVIRCDGRESMANWLRTAWAEGIVAPLAGSYDAPSVAFGVSLGRYGRATRATDLLGQCLPMLSTHPVGSPIRDHLVEAIAFLEAAAAVEAIIGPRPAQGTTDRLHRENKAWSGMLAATLADTRQALKQAFSQGSPATIHVSDIWDLHVRPAVSDLLKASHGLALGGVDLTRSGDRAVLDVILTRWNVTTAWRWNFGDTENQPGPTLSCGVPGNLAPVGREEIHRILHEGRADAPSTRLVSRIKRHVAGVGRQFAVGTTGLRTVRVAPLPSARDEAEFHVLLRRIEALADGTGVAIETVADGVPLRAAGLLAAGYAWSGRKGETVLAWAGASPGDPVADGPASIASRPKPRFGLRRHLDATNDT